MTVYTRKRGLTKNPFWTDMSEMGIARRKKAMQKVSQDLKHLLDSRPKPKDIPPLDPENESDSEN